MSARILLLDIETAPHRVYAWGLHRQNISINQIEEPGYTLCWAAKWLGEKKIMFRSVHHHGAETMLEDMHKLLCEADIVVHYNGARFDVPTLYGEFIATKMKPPAPFEQIDLYRIVRATTRLASNKLDYVLRKLDLGSKVQHKGMPLWTGCMAGVAADWRVMKRYNIGDVRELEPLYLELRPWITRHPNMALYQDEEATVPTCPNCGSTDLISNGIRRTRVQKYRRFNCRECGAWSRERLRISKAGAGVLT